MPALSFFLRLNRRAGTTDTPGTVHVSGGPAASDRLAFIDGLRAVAVLSVMASHLPALVPQLAMPDYLQHVPRHGVDLFFVLSGFCLSFPTLRRLYATGNAKFDVARYAAKRLLRIIPPYYATIVILLGASAFVGTHVSLLDVARQAIFVDRNTALLNPSFWTLALEFRWYFVFPLLLLLWTVSRRAFMLVLALDIAAFYFTRAFSYDVGALPGFMLGIIAADMYASESLSWTFLPLWALAAFVAAIITPENHAFSNQVWPFASLLFVLSACRVAWLRKILSFPPLAAIGTISYSLYLIHDPVMTFVQRSFGTHLGVVAAFAATAASLVAGAALWAIVERPLAGALKRPLVERLERPLARLIERVGIARRIGLKGTAPAAAAIKVA